MENYSVKEVADILKTNPETVRRWIRDGKLKAVQESRKGGNSITEKALQNFLNSNVKYKSIAASSMAFSSVAGVAGILGGVLGTVIIDQVIKEKEIRNSEINPNEVINKLQEEINNQKALIQKKRKKINKLETEIEEHKKQISSLRVTESLIKEQIES